MLGATNNYDFAYEAPLTRGVLDAEGKPVDKVVEDNYARDITRCCQKTVKVLTSSVGTLVLLCLYLAAGAWMFQYLERGNELEACYSTYARYRDKLNTSVVRATGIVDSGLPKDVVASQLETALIDFAETLFALDFPPSKNCTKITETFGSEWNWVSALYFCATVVTTIGYGHVAPATQWGRLVCMFYSILGIPLILIYLGSIGQMLAYLFRFTYMNICCCRCFRDIKIRRRNKRQLRLMRLQEDLRRHMEMRARVNGEPIPPPRMAPVVIDDESDEDDEIREIYREFQDTEDAGIPITIVMLVIAAYVAIGAFLFRIWEVDWTPIDGAYFAVITISTIGFGDLVPGNGRFDQPETITELLIGALYCVVGLALLSMCFELMKEEFVDKFRWIGRSLRIVGQNEQNSGDINIVEEIRDGDGAGEEYVAGDFSREARSYAPGEDNELFDSASVVSTTKSNSYHDACHSKNYLGNASPKMKKSVCVLRKHKGHCVSSVRSRSMKHQMSQKSPSVKAPKNEEASAYDEGELDMSVVGSEFGEDNEAFGGDMVVDEMEKPYENDDTR